MNMLTDPTSREWLDQLAEIGTPAPVLCETRLRPPRITPKPRTGANPPRATVPYEERLATIDRGRGGGVTTITASPQADPLAARSFGRDAQAMNTAHVAPARR